MVPLQPLNVKLPLRNDLSIFKPDGGLATLPLWDVPTVALSE